MTGLYEAAAVEPHDQSKMAAGEARWTNVLPGLPCSWSRPQLTTDTTTLVTCQTSGAACSWTANLQNVSPSQVCVIGKKSWRDSRKAGPTVALERRCIRAEGEQGPWRRKSVPGLLQESGRHCAARSQGEDSECLRDAHRSQSPQGGHDALSFH